MTMNLTVAGLNVLLSALSGSTITFTKIQIGNGNQQSLDNASALANPLMTLTLDNITTPVDSSVTLSATLNNSAVSSGFRMTEVGIFCVDPTDDTKEVLYAYGVEPSETANWIAPSSSEVREATVAFTVFIGNAENVAAQINQSLVYATKAEFDAHVADHTNPHGVTKTQVGLGNVPNVSTNNQTPTWTEPAAVSAPSSGETFSVIMGKIAKAIKSLISHIANKNNPHEVTAAQAGAAPASHTHGASAINSGTLSVARGGTGKSSYTANGILYANSANTLSQIAAPKIAGKVLTQGPSGAPQWTFASACYYSSYIFQEVSYVDIDGDETEAIPIEYPEGYPIPKVVVIFCINGDYGILYPFNDEEYHGFSREKNATDQIVSQSLIAIIDRSNHRFALCDGLNKLNEVYNYFMIW